MDNRKKDLGGVLYLVGKARKDGFPFRIRLQKMILLGEIEFDFPFSFDYSSYFYGPYAPELQSLLDRLVEDGLIKEECREIFENNFGYFYSITPNGRFVLKKIGLSKKLASGLDKLWDKYKNFSTGALVRTAKDLSGIKSIDE
jgi:uncharacterized protein YwgA